MSDTQTMKPEPATQPEADRHAPRKLTLAENAIMTVKLLAGIGALGAALWGLSVSTQAK